jgi:putative hemolysin|tara:strand:+ start:2403 stop:3380 length:978 start_codon:yes stop_codon:yes gene_type:complete
MSAVYIALGIMLLGLFLSALYSGLETGLYTINQVRLDVRASSKIKSAIRLRAIIDSPTRMLAVLLVCNNVANYLASYGAARMLEETTLGPWLAISINAIVMIPLLFIFGEILPKDLFRAHTDVWTYKCSSTLRLTDTILWWTGIVPIVASTGKLARKVLGSESAIEPSPRRKFGLLFKEGLEGGLLSDEQITLADRVLAMQSLTVQQEMIPWSRVSCLSESTSIQRRSIAVRSTEHTRIPIVNARGSVIGVLPVLQVLLAPETPTKDLLIEALYVTPHTKVQDALHQLRESGRAMAIVSTDGKTPKGIVTLKDLVEPIVGELAAW